MYSYPVGKLGNAGVRVTLEGILLSLTGIPMPAGDPERARLAAGEWRAIAQRIEDSGAETGRVERLLTAGNVDQGIAGFRGYYTKRLGPYITQVVGYVRSLAQACDDYARVLDETKQALRVIAIALYASIAATIAWPYLTGAMWYRVDQLAFAARLERFVFSKTLARILERMLKSLLYYNLDAIGYAGSQQLLQLGVYGAADLGGLNNQRVQQLAGFDPLSFHDNARQFGTAYVADLGFNAVYSTTKLPGIRRAFPTEGGPLPQIFRNGRGLNGALGNFGSRMAGAETYTYVQDVLNGQSLNPAEQPKFQHGNVQLIKLFIHVPAMGVRYTPRP